MKFTFDPFYVEYEDVTSTLYSFKEECILAAKKAILQNVENLPIIILLSGGIDSEIVAKSFLEAGIPFKALIGRYIIRLASETVTFNQHDWEYAINFCKKHNIEYYFCDIDLFTDARVISYLAKDNYSFSPQFACHMYMMNWCKQNNYFYVSGHGEITIVLYNGEYHSKEEQRRYVLELFRIKHNILGIFNFFKQDSRLIRAFLHLPTVKKLIEDKVPNLIEYKHQCYADVFEFEHREKQTGFENIQFWDSIIRRSLKKVIINYDNHFYIPIKNFFNK